MMYFLLTVYVYVDYINLILMLINIILETWMSELLYKISWNKWSLVGFWKFNMN